MIATLRRAARNVIRESWLVCPECGGNVALLAGTYWCVQFGDGNDAHCHFTSTSLQPLRAVPKESRR